MANTEIISIAIPAFNSSAYIELAFKEIYDDPRVTEIVVVDDHSDDFPTLERKLAQYEKVKLVRNEENLGGFWNKQKAVSLCVNKWVGVLDSDNRLTPDYLEAWYDVTVPDQTVIYCPVKGRDSLNYKEIEAEYMGLEEIKDYLEMYPVMTTKFLNTGNYIVNREKYLSVFRGKVNKSVPCAIAFNYLWLLAGYQFFICPNMNYVHTVGFGRFWKDNVKYMQPIVNDIVLAISTGKPYDLP
jgi:glycosyltransferase involved in cell wall biosynthesis